MPGVIPVINRITANVEQTIMGISPGAGFACTLVADRLAQLPPSPYTGLAMVRKGKPEHATDNVPQGWVEWQQPYTVLVTLLADETSTLPPDDLLAIFVADIDKAVRKDLTRGGMAIYTSHAEADDEYPTEGIFHVAATFRVQYRTLQNDPYSGMGVAS